MRSFVMKTAFFMDKTLALPFPDKHRDQNPTQPSPQSEEGQYAYVVSLP